MAESVEVRAGATDIAVEARVGELLNGYLDRRARGEQISEEVLLAEHPDVADVLVQHLSMLRALVPSPNVIRELLAKKVLSPSGSPDYAAELGNYRIIDVIGRGGMGIVLRAIELPLNRPVALKILRPELAVDRRALIRFEHEAQAAAALRHPNIVTVYACGECDGTHFLAMELIDGPSLADLLARQSDLPTDEIRRIFGELLQGLAAAHAAELIHRDIKSSNILLDGPDRQVKIADFGLARITASNTRVTVPQSAIGTPEYMSPEQARGDENVDHRTDLYSAGVVLYEMLTGRVPFKGDSPSALIHSILNTEPPAPRALRRSADKHLSRLALRLMSKRPEDRFDSAGTVFAALEARTIIRHPQRRRAMRRRILGSIVVLAALVGGGLLVLLVAPSSRTGGLAWSGRPPVSEAWVEIVGDKKTRTILARYGQNVEPEVFYTLPAAAKSAVDATVVALGGGKQLVVVGVEDPWEGTCLYAFDAQKNPVWRLDMSDERRWPDCGEPTKWRCRGIVAGELNGAPGQEIAVTASDRNEYPTRISIVDPKSGKFGPTYWHLGQISTLQLVENYFGEGHSAIVAWGQSNKLDGFGKKPPRPYVTLPGEDKPQTEYNLVAVVMVLDPWEFDSSGPPRVPQLPDLPQRLPHAYALLDMPSSDQADFVPDGSTARRAPTPQEMGSIQRAERVACGGGGTRDMCFDVHVSGGLGLGGAILPVDRNLSLCATPVLAGPARTDFIEQDWAKRWRPIVQHGEYVLP